MRGLNDIFAVSWGKTSKTNQDWLEPKLLTWVCSVCVCVCAAYVHIRRERNYEVVKSPFFYINCQSLLLRSPPPPFNHVYSKVCVGSDLQEITGLKSNGSWNGCGGAVMYVSPRPHTRTQPIIFPSMFMWRGGLEGGGGGGRSEPLQSHSSNNGRHRYRHVQV